MADTPPAFPASVRKNECGKCARAPTQAAASVCEGWTRIALWSMLSAMNLTDRSYRPRNGGKKQ
jgi:hypothetical protein